MSILEVFMEWVSDSGNRLSKIEVEAAHAEGLFTDAEYLFYLSEVV
jgi:hypothetical protein